MSRKNAESPLTRRGRLRPALRLSVLPVIPPGAVVAVVYVGWFAICFIALTSMIHLDEVEALWLSRTSFGVSLLFMANLVNILFLVYLALTLFAGATVRGRKGATFWASQTVGIVLVALAQVVLFRTGHLARNWREIVGPEYLAFENKRRGEQLLEEGGYEGAIEEYTKVIALLPDDAEARENRGTAHLALRHYDLAIEDLTRAIDLHLAGRCRCRYLVLTRHPAWLYLARGQAYYHRGEHDKAIEDYTKAIEDSSDYAEAYDRRACAYGQKGDYARAIEDHHRALELRPREAPFFYDRGLSYHLAGDLNRARADYEEAAKLDPKGKAGAEARRKLSELSESER